MMKTLSEVLSSMEYPGRFFVLGNQDENLFVLYGITARSASSQARKIIVNKSKSILEDLVLRVKPTDSELLSLGNPNLLIYKAVMARESEGGCIAVSNGAQTEHIFKKLGRNNALDVLANVHRQFEYEPDPPNYTPRISGILTSDKRCVIGRITKDEEFEIPLREEFSYSLLNKTGRFISTYSGANTNPLPSFREDPILVEADYRDSKEAVNAAYESIIHNGNNDFRVSVAGIFHLGDYLECFVFNRFE